MSVDDSYSEWCLGRLAQRVREGWLYVDISPNNRCLIRPDRDCDISSCPQRGTVHRHQPTLEDREEAHDIVTEWLALEFRREGAQKDIRELNRIFALEDPRPSRTFDVDAVSIAECHRIWRKRTGVQHTLNLLPPVQANQRLITPADLRAEAKRLIAAGRMPNLDDLLKAVAKAREKYRTQILTARKRANKRD